MQTSRPNPNTAFSATLKRFLVTSAIALGVPAAAALPVIAEAVPKQPATPHALQPAAQSATQLGSQAQAE
jgi:hypothetical protein